VRIEANNVIRDCALGNGVVVHPNCHMEGAVAGDDCEIGPFARLRPGAELATRVKVGNFVEIKKSTVADGSKVNHLTYIGDSEIGVNVNVGAGTITCNYDGANKHRTKIGDGAFIGSSVNFVAPRRSVTVRLLAPASISWPRSRWAVALRSVPGRLLRRMRRPRN
jgi:bifunctional UDP-N-acetylglucosamine pyrophosphorylase/glucosamine-1-phosphate N-acetyltransferase